MPDCFCSWCLIALLVLCPLADFVLNSLVDFVSLGLQLWSSFLSDCWLAFAYGALASFLCLWFYLCWSWQTGGLILYACKADSCERNFHFVAKVGRIGRRFSLYRFLFHSPVPCSTSGLLASRLQCLTLYLFQKMGRKLLFKFCFIFVFSDHAPLSTWEDFIPLEIISFWWMSSLWFRFSIFFSAKVGQMDLSTTMICIFVHCPVALVTGGMRLRVKEGLCVLCSASGCFVVLLGLVFDFADACSD